MAAFAGLAALMLAAGTAPVARAQGAAASAAPGGQPTATKRNYKDNGEFDLYNQAFKDSQNPAAQIKDLETWAQKYPDSDYKDVRTGMLVQAYSGLNPPQPAKVLDLAQQLMSKDLKIVFDDPQDGKRQALAFLFNATFAAGLAGSTALPNPTPAQVDLGRTAAKRLKDEAKAFFVPANKPPATPDADWTKTHANLDAAADHTLLVLTIFRAEATMLKTPRVSAECKDIAEPAYRKALADYPGNSYVSYKLAQALQCQQKESPDKVFQAIYEYERAAVVDPTLGGAQSNAAVIPAYADKAYIGIHGSADGLDELKQQVKQSALPPDGFKFKTASEIAAEKQAEFEQSNPELAMWMKIKSFLTDPADPTYFEDKLKDTEGPTLKGVVVDGACRGKEITVAFPMPDQTGPLTPEVKLKFTDTALAGKPTPNTEITFEKAVATAFIKEPFLLTMEVQKANVTGLKTTPCVPAQTKKAAPPAPPAKK
jgi:hypothetical protein